MAIAAEVESKMPIHSHNDIVTGQQVGAGSYYPAKPNGEIPKPTRSSDVSTTKSYEGNQYTIPLHNQFAYKPRKLKVFTIGAGFSGLLVAHKLQHRFPDLADLVDHTIFEARKDIGGTWLVNHYPGVQCDVPAHIYVSLFIT